MVRKSRNGELDPGSQVEKFKYEVAQEMGLSARSARRQVKKAKKED